MLGTFSNFALILPDAMLCSNRGVLLLSTKKPMGAKGALHLALGGIRRHTDCSAQVLRDNLAAQGLLSLQENSHTGSKARQKELCCSIFVSVAFLIKMQHMAQVAFRLLLLTLGHHV